MRRTPLPETLGRAFTVADAQSAGVPRSRLRANDLRHPFHGVRAAGGDRELDGERMLLARAAEYAPRMTEHEFFSHVTAAVLWGVPLPTAMVFDGRVESAVCWPRRAPAAAGVRGHALRAGLVDVLTHPATGLRVSSPASTWAMLGCRFRRVEDAVAAADALVRVPMHRDDPPALTTVAQLAAAVRAGRRIGSALLLEALPLVHERSGSRPETFLRLLVVGAPDLPEPEVNADVFHRGEWLGRVDLRFPAQRVILEYEGEHHLTDPAQWAADIARADRLTEAGWRVIRVTKADLFDRPLALLHRIRRAVAAGA